MVNKKLFVEIPLFFTLGFLPFFKKAEKKVEKKLEKVEQNIKINNFLVSRWISIKNKTDISEVEQFLDKQNIHYEKTQTKNLSFLIVREIPSIFCFVDKKYSAKDYDYDLNDIINNVGSFIKPSIATTSEYVYIMAEGWGGFIMKNKDGVRYRSLSKIIEFEGKKINNPSFVVEDGYVKLIVDGWDYVYRFNGNKLVYFSKK